MIEWQYRDKSNKYLDCDIYFNSMMTRQLGDKCPEDSHWPIPAPLRSNNVSLIKKYEKLRVIEREYILYCNFIIVLNNDKYQISLFTPEEGVRLNLNTGESHEIRTKFFSKILTEGEKDLKLMTTHIKLRFDFINKHMKINSNLKILIPGNNGTNNLGSGLNIRTWITEHGTDMFYKKFKIKLDNLVNILFKNWPRRVFWGGLEMTYGEEKKDLLQLWSSDSKNYDDRISGIRNGVSYISGRGDAINVGFHHKGTYGLVTSLSKGSLNIFKDFEYNRNNYLNVSSTPIWQWNYGSKQEPNWVNYDSVLSKKISRYVLDKPKNKLLKYFIHNGKIAYIIDLEKKIQYPENDKSSYKSIRKSKFSNSKPVAKSSLPRKDKSNLKPEIKLNINSLRKLKYTTWVCKYCGNVNSKDNTICLKCGINILKKKSIHTNGQLNEEINHKIKEQDRYVRVQNNNKTKTKTKTKSKSKSKSKSKYKSKKKKKEEDLRKQ